MPKLTGLLVATVLSLGACATNSPTSPSTSTTPTATPSAPSEIASETFFVPASDNPTIQIHVRNKHRAGVDRFTGDRIVLFVHGATYPSESAFDIDLPGGSWLDLAAARGFDAYFMDVRGYGRS